VRCADHRRHRRPRPQRGEVHLRLGHRTYAIGLWGDLPYSTTQATVGVANLIADMNSQQLAFTAHDEDLKSGSSECTDAVYTQALSYFNSLRAPAVFTPGDNDRTDCDRTPGCSSRAQLGKERQLFFSTPFTLGRHHLRQEVQQTPECLGAGGASPCVENRLVALREQVIAFRRPVVYVHGDSHYFRIDKPFLNSQGRRRFSPSRRRSCRPTHRRAGAMTVAERSGYSRSGARSASRGSAGAPCGEWPGAT
jgi:hypothetical protein